MSLLSKLLPIGAFLFMGITIVAGLLGVVRLMHSYAEHRSVSFVAELTYYTSKLEPIPVIGVVLLGLFLRSQSQRKRKPING